MSNYDKYEEEINIFTLFWFVLSKWRSILIVAIIGLVLGAGYAVVSSGEGEAPEGAEEESVEVLIVQQAYEATLARVESLEKYLTEAAIMQMNPYGLYRGTINYVIEAPHNELTAVNAAVYSFVWDGTLGEALAEVGPYSVTELDYLLGLNQSISTNPVVSESAVGQATNRITICADSEEEAQQLLEQIQMSLDAYLNALSGEEQKITYQNVSNSIKAATATGIADHQASMKSKYDTEKANLDAYKAAYEDATKQSSVVGDESSVDVSAIAKYGIVGLAAGIILAAIVWILLYFLSGKLYTVSDREKRFDVKLLGTIHDYEKLGAIDRWFGRKLGGVCSNLPLEEQRNIVLLNVKNALKKHTEAKRVFLLSSTSKDVEALCGLKSALTTAGYEVIGYESTIEGADVLGQIAPDDAVVVVEDNKHAKTLVVETEIRTIKEYTSNLVGMVVVQNKA